MIFQLKLELESLSPQFHWLGGLIFIILWPALASCVSLGLNLRETVKNLNNLPQIPGRLESVSIGRAFEVFVDYAHTPDALEKTLLSLKELDPEELFWFSVVEEREMLRRELRWERSLLIILITQ